jgi:hypothetical protein
LLASLNGVLPTYPDLAYPISRSVLLDLVSVHVLIVLEVSDGPSGARGEIFGENVPAAFLPSGVSMGATWDKDLMYEMGQLIGDEVTSGFAKVLVREMVGHANGDSAKPSRLQ